MKKLLIDWLRDHELLSIHQLEKKAGLAQGTLHKAIKGTRELADRHVPPLVEILQDYGFRTTAADPAPPASLPGAAPGSA